MWYETMHRPLMKIMSEKGKGPTVQGFCSYKKLRLLTELTEIITLHNPTKLLSRCCKHGSVCNH
jgi:hypothetical protein